MADLKQALIWLAEGKKIKDHHTAKNDYFHMGDTHIVNKTGFCSAAKICGTGWELYEEPKPMLNHHCISESGFYECVTSEYAQYGYFGFKAKDQFSGIICSLPFCPYCGKNSKSEEPKPIPPPEYDPREVQLKNALVDDGDYIVWDKNGYRHFAYWDSDEKAFYSITNGNTFALDVKKWKDLPNRGDE